MNLKQGNQQPLWAEAQRRCRLSDEALQMAKELRLNPRSLIKNIPSPSEPRKAPVEDWVRAMAAKGGAARSRHGPQPPDSMTAPTGRKP